MNPNISIGGHDVGLMLSEFAKSIPDLNYLTGAIAYMLGVFFMITAAMALRTHTQQGANDSSHLNHAIWSFFLGMALIFLNSTMQTSTETIFGAASSGALDFQMPSGMNPKVAEMALNIMKFIQMVGYIAFVRGIMILKDSSKGRHSNDSSVAKGMIHIVGATVAIHLDKATSVLGSTFGW